MTHSRCIFPPNLQDSCNKHQEWYQSIKDTQGSVENMYFDEMKNIKNYGYYTIGSQSLDVHTSLKEVVQLDLERRDKRLTQLKYTLDDLRDLESKLVLITSQESGEGDLFIKVCFQTDILMIYAHGNYWIQFIFSLTLL